MNNISKVPQLLVIGIICTVLSACNNAVGNQPSGNTEHSPAAPPTSLQLEPDTLYVTPQASGTFQATLLDENGNVVEGPVTWEATGGNIHENGVFEAGSQLGDYSITARSENGLADTSLIFIKRPLDAPSTWIYPGENIQAVVNEHAAGTEFLIKEGIHRMQSIEARTGDSYRGEPGSILSGAKELTDFVREGNYWVAIRQTQENPRYGPNEYGDEVCWDGTDGIHEDSRGCIFPEDLFFDDEPLRQVTHLSEVGPAAWYFDYDADRIYMHDDPTGHKVETSVLWDAITGNGAHHAIVESLIIEKYANAAQHAALHFVHSDGVIVANNEIRSCHGQGINITAGNDGQIIDNYVHHNGQMGLSSSGAIDLRIAGNEVSYNNYAGYNSSWEAGGSKFGASTRLVIRDNNVHHNEGKGLWTDGNDIETLIELNEVYENSDHGILREIGYSALIRNNTVTYNGWHGIVVDSSPDVEVHDNIIQNNGWNWTTRPLAQIVARDTRNGAPGAFGPWEVRNLWVHDNRVEGEVVAGVTGPEHVFSNGYNNRFDANSYFLSTQQPFAWLGALRGEYEWLVYGHDLNGTFHR